MWTCPVCGQQCATTFCAQCGFDYSTHYERFPTLQPLPKQAQAVSKLRALRAPKNTLKTCPCCGGEFANGHCLYCHFTLEGPASNEDLRRLADRHSLLVVNNLSDFAIETHRYRWAPDRSRLQKIMKKFIPLGNAPQFYNATHWAAEKFAQVQPDGGTELKLTINYKYRGKPKTLTCAIPTVKCDDFWRLGIRLDSSFHLRFFLGSGTQLAESAPIALDLT